MTDDAAFVFVSFSGECFAGTWGDGRGRIVITTYFRFKV
jgi:hypothetical protein